MLGFKTINGEYRISKEEKLIWGGVLGNTPHKFSFLRVIQGGPAEFLLDNGRYYVTSTVKAVITIFNM